MLIAAIASVQAALIPGNVAASTDNALSLAAWPLLATSSVSSVADTAILGNSQVWARNAWCFRAPRCPGISKPIAKLRQRPSYNTVAPIEALRSITCIRVSALSSRMERWFGRLRAARSTPVALCGR